MHAPVSMLIGAGNSKAVAVIAVLVGFFVVASIQKKQAEAAAATAAAASAAAGAVTGRF